MGAKDPVPEMAVTPVLAASMAEKADLALITLGRISGEGIDRTATEGDFYLTATEKEMIKNVSEAFHAKGKKAVVILNVAGVLEVASWRNLPDAILLAWLPGQEGGNSVVDVLSGKVNPSGKLAVTFPNSYQDTPSAKNFPGIPEKSDKVDKADDLSGFSFMRRKPWQVTYEEDIYVGYRYYTSFKVPVAYEFGYGLSYTSYQFSNLKVNAANFTGVLTASVEVKNIGTVAGREVAQVYVSAPSGKLNKPAETLVAFSKSKLLKPGESQTLSFKIATKDIASFDENTSTWIAEAGEYKLKVGDSSLAISQSAPFTLAKTLEAGKVSKALAPTVKINKLIPIASK